MKNLKKTFSNLEEEILHYKKEKNAVNSLFDKLKSGINPIFYNSEKVKLFYVVGL